MTDTRRRTIDQHLDTIEHSRSLRGQHWAMLRLAALVKLVAEIRSAPKDEQESLASHATARLKPIAHELSDLWEPAGDMILAEVQSDDEPAIDPLAVLADLAPSMVKIDRALERLGREWREAQSRLN